MRHGPATNRVVVLGSFFLGQAGEPRPPTVAECAALLTPWVQTFALTCGAAVASGVGVLAHVPRWHGLPE